MTGLSRLSSTQIICAIAMIHDNAPHQKWSNVSTFPKHCHDGEQNNVTASFLPDEPEVAVKAFLSLFLTFPLRRATPYGAVLRKQETAGRAGPSGDILVWG